jgi:hypothetical protein
MRKRLKKTVKKFFSRLFRKKVTPKQLKRLVKTQKINLPEPNISGIDQTLK